MNDTFHNNSAYNDTLEVLSRIHETYGGDLVMLPGDTNNGKWDQELFHVLLHDFLDIQGMTNNETIALGGKNCYSTTKRLFEEAGYDKILVALGDHELGEYCAEKKIFS